MTLRQRYSRYIGDRAFYKALLGILVPVVLQNSLTNLVSLLDNIMIGSVGTEQMSGISIVNQLINVFNICVYGALSGASIFTVQFIGSKDLEGVRHTFRFKMFAVFAALALGIGIFTVYGETLISLYLHEGGDTGDLAATLVYGKEYLAIMLWGLIPFVVQQAYASTMREVGETVLPMKAGIVAIFVNLVLNYLLIFGKFGFPVMGVRGAALATVLSRFVETSIIVVWAHTHKKKLPFIEHVYRSLRVPLKLVGQILLRGYPLLINEFLWAAAMALISQSFSIRGLAAVASMNINTTIANLFNVVWLSMGTVVAIMIGRPLGANDFDEARETLRQTIAFSVVVSTVIALILAVLSPLFPMLYNTTQEVRDIATRLLLVVASIAPVKAFTHACYYAIRAGGRTWITFLFDSAYLWILSLPIARLLVTFTDLPIVPIYAASTYADLAKGVFGYILIKKEIWINNLVSDKN